MRIEARTVRAGYAELTTHTGKQMLGAVHSPENFSYPSSFPHRLFRKLLTMDAKSQNHATHAPPYPSVMIVAHRIYTIPPLPRAKVGCTNCEGDGETKTGRKKKLMNNTNQIHEGSGSSNPVRKKRPIWGVSQREGYEWGYATAEAGKTRHCNFQDEMLREAWFRGYDAFMMGYQGEPPYPEE